MTWQDELQHLDAELAAGRLSPEDYRARREALLGQAQQAPQSGGFAQQGTPSPGFPQQGMPSGGFPQQNPQPQNPQQQNPQQQNPQSGGFPQQNPAQPGGFGEQQHPQQGQNPFPPAFNWGDAARAGQQGVAPQPNQPQPQTPAPGAPQPMSGQPMSGPQPVSGQPTSGQPVGGQPGTAQPGTPQPGVPQPGSQQPGSHQPQPAGQSESTQVVNVNNLGQQPPQSPAQGWPQQGWDQNQQPQFPQTWGAADANGPAGANAPSTPWDEPETPEHGDTSWMRQGPEVFDTAGKSGKGKMITGIALGAVLLVVVVVAGIFYFTSGSAPRAEGDKTTEQQPPPPPAPTTSELPEPPAAKPAAPANPQEALIAPPVGEPHPYTGPLDRKALEGPQRGGLLPKPVLQFALQNGVSQGWFNGTTAEPGTTLIALQMPNEQSAMGLANTYLKTQEGLAEVEDLSMKGVKVVSTGGGTIRTAYTTHNWTIIVDVHGGDAKKSQELFQVLLSQQLSLAPPTVRD